VIMRRQGVEVEWVTKLKRLVNRGTAKAASSPGDGGAGGKD